MQRRNDETAKPAAAGLAAVALALSFAGCSTEPYRIEPTTDPPWEIERGLGLPKLQPPLSSQARRISLCYGTAVNSEEDVLALAEEVCGDGRLVLEHQNAFWNGCSMLQPTRATYICDPPEEAAAVD